MMVMHAHGVMEVGAVDHTGSFKSNRISNAVDRIVRKIREEADIEHSPLVSKIRLQRSPTSPKSGAWGSVMTSVLQN